MTDFGWDGLTFRAFLVIIDNMKNILLISTAMIISIPAFAVSHEEPVTHQEVLKEKNRHGHPTAPRHRDFVKYGRNQEAGSHPRGSDVLNRPRSPSASAPDSSSGEASPR